jgi:hypothetical protein
MGCLNQTHFDPLSIPLNMIPTMMVWLQAQREENFVRRRENVANEFKLNLNLIIAYVTPCFFEFLSYVNYIYLKTHREIK